MPLAILAVGIIILFILIVKCKLNSFLSLNHSRSHMIRAGMEGICFSLNCLLSA